MRRWMAGCCAGLLVMAAWGAHAAGDMEELLKKNTEELMDMQLESLLLMEISSAGKMTEKVAEIPASVVVITRADIERYGYRTTAELLRNIPGFYTTYNYGPDAAGVRGVMSSNNIVVLVNGVPQHENDFDGVAVGVEQIDRVEIVRGPMSVIYGSGAFLGSINIVTNQVPYGEPLSMVSASYGTNATYKGFARKSGESGDLKYTVNASVWGTEGLDVPYDELMSSEEMDRLNAASVRSTDGKLERKNANANFSMEWKDLYADVQYNRTRAGFFDGGNVFYDGHHYVNETAAFQLGYRPVITDHWKMDARILYSLFDVEQEVDGYPPDTYGAGAMAWLDGGSDRVEIEVDVVWEPSDWFNMITGLYFKRFMGQEYDGGFPTTLVSDPSRYNISGGSYDFSDQETRALFSQVNIRPFQRLKLVLGARAEQYMAYDTRLILRSGDAILIDNATQHNEEEDIHFLPRAAVVYSITDNHIVKFMYGKANKPFTETEIDLERMLSSNIEPEEIETFEANYLMNYQHYSLGFSLFRNDIDNLVALSATQDDSGDFSFGLSNYGRMVTQGIELTATATPFAALHLEGGLTYQDTEAKTEGVSVSHSPHLLANAKVSYRWKDVTASLCTWYVGEMSSNAPSGGQIMVDNPSPDGAVSTDPATSTDTGGAGTITDATASADAVAPPADDGGGSHETAQDTDDYWVVDLNVRYDHPRSGFSRSSA